MCTSDVFSLLVCNVLDLPPHTSSWKLVQVTDLTPKSYGFKMSPTVRKIGLNMLDFSVILSIKCVLA